MGGRIDWLIFFLFLAQTQSVFLTMFFLLHINTTYNIRGIRWNSGKGVEVILFTHSKEYQGKNRWCWKKHLSLFFLFQRTREKKCRMDFLSQRFVFFPKSYNNSPRYSVCFFPSIFSPPKHLYSSPVKYRVIIGIALDFLLCWWLLEWKLSRFSSATTVCLIEHR